VRRVADIILDRFQDQLMEIYLKGGIASRVMKKIKGELNSTPTKTELNDLYQREFFLVQDKAHELIGFYPEFEIEKGLQYTAEWLQLHELLTQPLPWRAPDLDDERYRTPEYAS